MNASANRKTLLRKIATPVLIMLAVLLLILSCLLKRFLKLNQNTPTSVDRGVKPKTGLSTSTRYNSNCCCSSSQKIVSAQENKFSSHPKPDQNFAETGAPSVFDINFFLSRSENTLANPENKFSPLPLFLQHRSLLI